MLIGLAGCKSQQTGHQYVALDTACVERIMPTRIETAWYRANVTVYGKQISGLLLIKNMADSAYRVVFTNEGGVTFFDFGFYDKTTTVHSVIPQLNKRIVLKTLQKDFELILGLPFRTGSLKSWVRGEDIFFGIPTKKETACFITHKDCAFLHSLAWETPKKRMVSVELSGVGYPSPERLVVRHHTFSMEIDLRQINMEADKK